MTDTNGIAQGELRKASELLRSTTIVIPTCNASLLWPHLHEGLGRQRVAPDQVIIIDSSSTDSTQELVRAAGYRLVVVDRKSFRHGATRQMAADLAPKAKILLYLTQDAIPADEDCFLRLLHAFEDPTVGAAYGRQLARPGADPIERHARLFNYPSTSVIRDLESREEFGIKAAFFSNSFAAYRRSAFNEVGGFAKSTIVSEEVTAVAHMLMKGWRVAYRADAAVVHSHSFTIPKEFSRYFDIGVNHSRESWLLKVFGNANHEGRRFVFSEFRFLLKDRPSLLPIAMLRTLTKLIGYQLGKHESCLPNGIKRIFSDQPNCWRNENHEAHHRSIVAERRF